MVESNATVEDVSNRLHSAAIHLLRRARHEDLASGLGPARLSALSVIVFAGPLSLGQLAAAEQVRPPTMTRIVSGLEEAGLVRKREGRDRRSVLITATPKGNRLLHTARRRRVRALARRFAALPPDDLALLGRAAELIEQSVRDERA